jgi:hypothetical protein
MTPTEADQRIIKSRQTLHRYSQMLDAGDVPHPGTGQMVSAEIDVLDAIAAEHPIKAEKLANLVADWRALQGRLRQKLN